MKMLMTGGSGLLGREIRALDATIIAPARADMDITDYASVARAVRLHRPDVILHLAASTKPPEHEKHPDIGIVANIIGTANMARIALEERCRLVYTSTDYVYAGAGPHREDEPINPPYNFGWSKLGGEASVRIVPGSLILRLSFGPVPFPWEKVYAGQWNSKLYVDEIASLVVAAARCSATGIMNIGGPRTTLEEYARRTRPDIVTIAKPDWVPADTSLDLTKMKAALNITDETSLLLR